MNQLFIFIKELIGWILLSVGIIVVITSLIFFTDILNEIIKSESTSTIVSQGIQLPVPITDSLEPDWSTPIPPPSYRKQITPDNPIKQTEPSESRESIVQKSLKNNEDVEKTKMKLTLMMEIVKMYLFSGLLISLIGSILLINLQKKGD